MKLRLGILLLIIVMLLGAATPLIALDTDYRGTDYEPLTPQEAEDWLRSIDLDELIVFTIHANYVERAVPEIVGPEWNVFVTNDEVIAVPDRTMTVAIGALSWIINIDEIRAPFDPIPQTPGWVYGLAGAAVGGAAVFLVLTVIG